MLPARASITNCDLNEGNQSHVTYTQYTGPTADGGGIASAVPTNLRGLHRSTMRLFNVGFLTPFNVGLLTPFNV